MRTRISVALNGIELHSLDGGIVLQGVDEGAASWNISAGNRAGNAGQHVTSVEISFLIHLIFEKRQHHRNGNHGWNQKSIGPKN